MKTHGYLLLFISFIIISCSKKMEEEHLYAEDNTPIDTTVVDSVVGQASFSEINAAIENAKKPKDSLITKKDSTTSKDKLKALEEKLKKEKELNERKAKELEEKKKKEVPKTETPPVVKQPDEIVDNQETKQ